MKKIYISGKISGIDLLQAKCMFKSAEKHLIEKYKCDVVNPMELEFKENTWEACMLKDIELLFTCDAIFMLHNWKDSMGARIELNIALETGKKIIFETNN
jgi:hypothetical protein